EDGDDRLQGAAGEIGELYSREHGRTSGKTVAGKYAGEGDVPDVVSGAAGPWAILAVSRDRADHQARVLLDERARSAAELVQDARTKPFDEHVGPRAESAEQRGTAGGLEIDGQRAFAAIERL